MPIDDYLKEQTEDGKVDSQGSFTLDLAKAAAKLAAFALPSNVHYLLKIVQVAHHLQAPLVEVKIERSRTLVKFSTRNGGSITDTESIFRAFSDPLTVTDPVMKDLVGALIGTITKENLETLWSYSEGHAGRRVYISKDRHFSIKDFVLQKPKKDDELPFHFTLSVLHPKTWKFWAGARRRAASLKVLEENCRFSASQIKIDGLEQKIEESSVANDHHSVTKKVYQDGQTYLMTYHSPADNILFELATADSPRFSVLRPSLSAYVVRGENLNLWVSGIRANNTMKPDGLSTASWVLQFLDKGESLSMRHVPKRVPCQALLSVARTNKDENFLSEDGHRLPLKVRIIRKGVTVLEQKMEEDDERFKAFRGCGLIFADESLETDLTGFQIVQDEAFAERILSYSRLLTESHQYFNRAKDMLTM